MARKKKYYYYKTKKQKEFDAILGMTIFIGIFLYASFRLFKEKGIPYLQEHILYVYAGVGFLVFIFGLFIYWKYNQSKKLQLEEQMKLDKIPEDVKSISEKIKTFKPLRDYSKEEPYQIELSGYLKNFFPGLDIEISKNYTRPDIIIDNIAIEIKGPTSFSDLKTIPDKIIRYTKEWDYLIIVLFNVNLAENKEKSKQIYDEWLADIEENFENKLDRIMFIKI